MLCITGTQSLIILFMGGFTLQSYFTLQRFNVFFVVFFTLSTREREIFSLQEYPSTQFRKKIYFREGILEDLVHNWLNSLCHQFNDMLYRFWIHIDTRAFAPGIRVTQPQCNSTGFSTGLKVSSEQGYIVVVKRWHGQQQNSGRLQNELNCIIR